MGLTRPRAHQLLDIDYKQSVRVITVSNVSLSGGAPNAVDGVSLSVNDRILVTGQTTGSQNGLYYIATLGTGANGTWTRSLDTNETGELLAGTIVMVTEGDTFKDTQWKLTTNDPITIGSTALVFEQNSAFAYGNIYANSTPVIAGSVGDTLTLTAGNNISITGNAAAKSVTIGVTGISLNSISNGTSNVNVVSSNGNVTVGINGTSNVAVFNSAGADISGTLNATGNATVGNLSTAGLIVATGNITGGNLVTAGSGNIGSLTVTANATVGNLSTAGIIVSTGNITGGNVTTAGLANVGTLTVNGASTFTGNLLPSANITYDLGSPTQRWREIYLSGNTIDIGGATISADLVTGSLILKGPDGAEFILTGSDANDAQGAFGFLRAGNAQTSTSTTTGALTVAGGAGIVGNLHVGAIFKATGNVEGGNLTTVGIGNIGTLEVTGNATVTGNANVGNLGTAGVITATGNITGGNIITGGAVSATGNINSGNVNTTIASATGNVTGGNLTTVGIANIATLQVTGTASITGNANITGTLNATGNANVGNLGTAGLIVATGNITGGNLVTAGSGNIGSLTVTGNANVGNLGTAGLITATANITGGNLVTAGSGNIGALTVTANANVGNLGTAGLITATGNIISVGNVSGNFMLGNGSQLSGINSFSSIAVTAGNTVSADSIADTLTLAAGSGITIVADSANDSITIALAQTGSNIFVNLADFGLVTEIVTSSDDLGSIEDTALILTDLEFIVTSGVFYPTQLVLPPYTVMTLPNASPSGQMIYVTDDSGGSVPAFSDGTDWRRVTDRAVVS